MSDNNMKKFLVRIAFTDRAPIENEVEDWHAPHAARIGIQRAWLKELPHETMCGVAVTDLERRQTYFFDAEVYPRVDVTLLSISAKELQRRIDEHAAEEQLPEEEPPTVDERSLTARTSSVPPGTNDAG